MNMNAKQFCRPKSVCTDKEITGSRKVIPKRMHCKEKMSEFGKPESGDKSGIPKICKQSIINHKIRSAGKKNQITVLNSKEVERIRNAALQTEEMRAKAALEEKQREREMLDFSISLMEHFRDIDRAKLVSSQAESDKLKMEKAQEQNKTLDRAFIAKHEKEEEVRMLSRLIGNTKWRAMIDAQVMAKKQSDEKYLSEIQRVEQEALLNDRKKMEELQEKLKVERIARLKYASDIKRQIEEKEIIRSQDWEREALESKGISIAHEVYTEQMETEKRKLMERRRTLRNQYDEIIQTKQLIKKINDQQEQSEESNRQAYRKARIDMERKEKADKKNQMEKFLQQQEERYKLGLKLVDAENHRYEMNCLQQEERADSDYRRREYNAAKKKLKLLEEMKEVRKMEKYQSLQRRAISAATAENEFNEFQARIKNENEREARKQMERRIQKNCYREELIKQINRREIERRETELGKLKEALASQEDERLRKEGIKAVIQSKIEKVRQTCIPQQYVHDIEMHFQKMIKKHNLSQI